MKNTDEAWPQPHTRKQLRKFTFTQRGAFLSLTSLLAQRLKRAGKRNLPEVQEIIVQLLGQEVLLEKG